ncbi:MAG: hypothetical protein Q8O84_02595 [Nanoarchaeota archaeon]|nr:hypothetical protein [Nanoarchaeota archaeon]
MAERAFLSFLILFLISLISGGFIFYQYNILVNREEVKTLENLLKFDEKTYKDVLNIWQEREKKFEETANKKYFDIFQEIK